MVAEEMRRNIDVRCVRSIYMQMTASARAMIVLRATGCVKKSYHNIVFE